jgi:hypothetical protein
MSQVIPSVLLLPLKSPPCSSNLLAHAPHSSLSPDSLLLTGVHRTERQSASPRSSLLALASGMAAPDSYYSPPRRRPARREWRRRSGQSGRRSTCCRRCRPWLGHGHHIHGVCDHDLADTWWLFRFIFVHSSSSLRPR